MYNVLQNVRSIPFADLTTFIEQTRYVSLTVRKKEILMSLLFHLLTGFINPLIIMKRW